jgi:hypothetical protein
LIAPSWAASSASSAASDSVTTSVGSLSDSLQGSSNSSRKTVAEGDYKVIDVAAAPERPGMVRLTLQPLAEHGADGEIQLTLPQRAADDGRLAAGQVVNAQRRPYGTQFKSGDTGKPFFLVLDDEWYRELQQMQAVTL